MEIPHDLFMELAEGARFEATTPGTPSDRRSSWRIQIALNATVVRLKPGASTKPLPVIIRDLSAGGVGIECCERFSVTERFALRVLRHDGSAVWLQYEVLRWTPVNATRYSIGGKFEKQIFRSKSEEHSAATSSQQAV